MIQRAITTLIGVIIGLLATFAVFSAILGGLDGFYLLTQGSCNYGTASSPNRTVRIAPEVDGKPGDADAIDWTADGLDVYNDDGNCVVDGMDNSLSYLTPTGDPFVMDAGSPETFSIVEDQDAAYVPQPASPTNTHGNSIATDGTHVWLNIHGTGEHIDAYVLAGGARAATSDIPLYRLNSAVDITGLYTDGTTIWVVDVTDGIFYAYDIATRASAPSLNFTPDLAATGNGTPQAVWSDGTYWWVVDHVDDQVYAYQASDGASAPDKYLTESFLAGIALTQPRGIHSDGTTLWVGDPDDRRLYAFDLATLQRFPSRDFSIRQSGTVGRLEIDQAGDQLVVWSNNNNDGQVQFHDLTFIPAVPPDNPFPWLEAEPVFTAQRQLVTLLAVIAAIGMPIGAMTAIVFFGQAVISSGVSGQVASQVIVAIGTVVVILVAVQMFQQFAGYLGDAFDAVSGDRFVVFDETLGSLAETIAEFWGVLAFAGLINIATIVWRNYSGNFSIGGQGGGLI